MINKSEKLIGHIVIQTLPQDMYPLSWTDFSRAMTHPILHLHSHLITDDKNIVNFSAARLLNSGLNLVPYPLIYKIPPPPPPHTHRPTRQLDALLGSGDVTSEIAEDDRERGWNKTTILDKINGKPRLPLPPKSRMGKWRVFALRAASSLIWGGWGFAVPFYFVQDCRSIAS